MSAQKETNPKVHTAPDTIPTRLVMIVAVIAVVVGVGSVWISSEILDATQTSLGRAPDRAAQASVNAPREIGLVDQTLMNQDRFGLRQRDEQRVRLESWGWADEREGTVRLPIDRAMELWLEQEAAR